ncbi:MAG: BMP family ABC transporter substrate-binding protein [Lautropia sp.]
MSAGRRMYRFVPDSLVSPGRRSWIRRGAAGLLASTPLAPALAQPKPPESLPLSVGFVFVSPIGDGGWTFQHNLGRLELERTMGERVRTRFVASVAEGPDAERVIRDLALQQHRLIFATSFGYMDSTLRVAREFPDHAFEHAGGYKLAPNVAVYNARVYEARYLAGVIAGHATKSKVLGYVAAMPIPEVLQGINAFTLGAREVDPTIETRVVWTNSWFDPTREQEAAATLASQQADVLTHHTDSSSVVKAAEGLGVAVIGYHSNMSAFAPKMHLASVTHHWGRYYVARAQALLAGEWRSDDTWGGLADGMVGLEAVSPKVSQAARSQYQRLAAEIRAFHLHPFTGPLIANDGTLRVLPHERIGDEQLARMDWLVEGVVGKV